MPPLRGVWLPAGVAHSHRAHGRTDLLSLAFPASADPFGHSYPGTSQRGAPQPGQPLGAPQSGHPQPGQPLGARQPSAPQPDQPLGDRPPHAPQPVVVAVGPLLREVIIALTADEPLPASSRALLRRVALDQLHRVSSLPLRLPQPRDDRVRRIAEWLTDDPSDPRTLAQLGAEAGAGERTLSRLFRRETGMSFPQWRTQLRLHHAQVLLAHGESVTATAHACGYRSASAFIEAFRAAYGTTPGRHAPPGAS